MWNLDSNTLDDVLYINDHDLGVLEPNFSDLLQYSKYTKTGINQPLDVIYIYVE